MPLNPLFTQLQLPTTSAAAIREFNERYLAAVGAAVPTGWADTIGEIIPTDRPEVTFPISQMHTLYSRTTGESRTRKLREAAFSVFAEEWDAGYEAKLQDLFLKVFAYQQWQKAPARLVLAEEQLRHNQIALILDGSGTRSTTATQGGVSSTCVDGQNFFSTSHPANFTDPTVSGTWSNYVSTPTNVLGSAAVKNTGTFLIDALQAQVTAMQTSVLDENGKLIGADPDTILVPYDYYEPLKNGLANERLVNFQTNTTSNDVAAAAIANVYKGKFNVVPVKEFTMSTGASADWYLIDSKLIKSRFCPPWITLQLNMPGSLAFRVFDESSDYFKETGNIKLSSHVWNGFALALPHAIRRIVGPTR